MNILSRDNDTISTGHSTINDIHLKFPHTKDYFSFAFVRNPWARLVSGFSMWKNISYDHPWSQWDSKEMDFCKNYDFKDFIYAIKINHIVKPHTQPYIGHYFEKPSDMNFIGKLEQYQNDFNFVCNQIGFPYKEVPHSNKSSHSHYSEYYDDETKEIVAKKYAEDIEYFGYKFENL